MEVEINHLEVFSSGLYSCKWRLRGAYQVPKYETLEKIFFITVVISYLMCSCWLYSWSVLGNDASDINQFLYDEIKDWFQWYILILVVSIVGAVYTLFLICAGLLHGLHQRKLHLSVCHKVLVVVFLALPSAGFAFIGNYWPDKDGQWGSIVASFDMTSPFMQICALTFWILFAIYISYLVHRVSSTPVKVLVIGAYIIFLIFLLTLPLWLHSPCIGQNHKNNTISKPFLFGHRGSPTQAPENTLFSFEKALNCNVYAFESDVKISKDGVPFLMHDSTLLRTTNVSATFPKRKDDLATSFTWHELMQLNAGEWYLKDDPFLTNKRLSEEDKITIRHQKIPSLMEWASLATKYNKTIIFDLARPPYNHPNRNNWVDVTINALFDSGIPQYNVLWLLSSGEQIYTIRSLAPGFRIAVHGVVSHPEQYGIDVFNLLYSMTTQEVVALNASIVSYTVDTSWTFSRSWCQGVWAVTTTTCPLLKEMSEPSWSLTKQEYLAMWIPIDIFSLIVLGIIVYCRHKRSKIPFVSFEFDGEMTASSITI